VDYTLDQLAELYQEVMSGAQIQLKGRTRGGLPGQTITVTLATAINGKNTLGAIAWAACPPGDCVVTKATDGNWYALSPYTSRLVEDRVRLRKSSPLTGSTLLILGFSYETQYTVGAHGKLWRSEFSSKQSTPAKLSPVGDEVNYFNFFENLQDYGLYGRGNTGELMLVDFFSSIPRSLFFSINIRGKTYTLAHTVDLLTRKPGVFFSYLTPVAASTSFAFKFRRDPGDTEGTYLSFAKSGIFWEFTKDQSSVYQSIQFWPATNSVYEPIISLSLAESASLGNGFLLTLTLGLPEIPAGSSYPGSIVTQAFLPYSRLVEVRDRVVPLTSGSGSGTLFPWDLYYIVGSAPISPLIEHGFVDLRQGATGVWDFYETADIRYPAPSERDWIFYPAQILQSSDIVRTQQRQPSALRDKAINAGIPHPVLASDSF